MEKNKIPTAEEFLDYDPKVNTYYSEELDTTIVGIDDVKKAMIEFAKLHVKQALEAAVEEVKVFVNVSILLDKPENKDKIKVYKQSILNAYPEDNII